MDGDQRIQDVPMSFLVSLRLRGGDGYGPRNDQDGEDDDGDEVEGKKRCAVVETV